MLLTAYANNTFYLTKNNNLILAKLWHCPIFGVNYARLLKLEYFTRFFVKTNYFFKLNLE